MPLTNLTPFNVIPVEYNSISNGGFTGFSTKAAVVDSTRFVSAFFRSGSLRAAVGTVTGNSISWGSEVALFTHTTTTPSEHGSNTDTLLLPEDDHSLIEFDSTRAVQVWTGGMARVLKPF